MESKTYERRNVEVFQYDVQGGGFATFMFKLPHGEEVKNTLKNRNMNYDKLKPFVGNKALLHVYNGKSKEYMYTEKVILEGFSESPFGGEVPHFFFEEEV